MPSRVIVTTTINRPTPALEEYAGKSGWELLVVLDQKSPPFRLPGAEVLSVDDQRKIHPELSDAIGWNCIQRRNMGYLHAIRSGAGIVATVDDDNIPVSGWGENLVVGTSADVTMFDSDGHSSYFDPLAVTSAPGIWHRGFPLTELRNRSYTKRSQPVSLVVDVEASLWLGDPDIDAICRLEHAPYLETLEGPTPFSSSLIGPFNSQNTFLTRRALADYFCFTEVGRFDDIWAAYHLQARGFAVAYTQATVRQERNDHDLVVDLRKETFGYTETPNVLSELAEDPEAVVKALPEGARRAYHLYRDAAQECV